MATASSSSEQLVVPGPPKEEAAAVGGGEEGGRRIDQVCLGGLKKARRDRVCTAKERISRMPPCAAGKRSSIYRGVTRHRWTGRYEAHLWDKSTWNQNQNKKGKQVYLGAYDDEEAAARAYDLAALKYWGAGTLINFPVSDYTRDLDEMQMVSKEDYLVSLRRKSSAFSKGLVRCRGVSRQPQSRWDASCSQMGGSEYFNNLNCSTSRDTVTEGKYAGGFGMERKIDLTSYIRWWAPKKTRPSESASSLADDVGRELCALEHTIHLTEPYQLPSLGLPQKQKLHGSSLSACSILSRSAAFNNFREKSSEAQDGTGSRNRTDTLLFAGAVLDRTGVTIGMDEFAAQGTPYTLDPLISVPLGSGWNTVDPAFWTSIVPPTGQSPTTAYKE